MKRCVFRWIIALAILLPCLLISVSAKKSGYYTYSVSGGKATITAVDTSISGAATIPSWLDGCPVTKIGYCAFEGCNNLLSVDIPPSITWIGNDAFVGCTSLAKVNISSLEAWCNIDYEEIYGAAQYNNPLYYAKKLYLDNKLITDLVIPEGVTTIKSCAFWYCESIKTVSIPDSVTSIGSSAFLGTNITSITIPSSVKSIGYYAFSDCTQLTKVNITDISSWCNMDFGYQFEGSNNPLFYAKNLYLNDVLVTDLIIPEDVASIGSYAFFNCSSIKSVSIPDTLEKVGTGAFSGCSNLSKVNISNVDSWCDIEFKNSLSNPLCYGASMCIDDKPLTDISIPNNISIVKNFAFYNCKSIQNIIIPNTLTGITVNAFYGCDNIENVYFMGTEDEWDALLVALGNDAITNANRIYPCTTEHTEETDAAIAATCTKTGLTEGKHCSVCKTVIVAQETVPASGHPYTAWTKVDEDTHTRNCPDCGATQQGSHDFSKWSKEDEENHTRTCSDCGATQQGGHDFSVWSKEDEENHTRTCSDCGATQQDGHDFSVWSKEDEENHTRTCSDCGTTQRGAHAWDNGDCTLCGCYGIRVDCTQGQVTVIVPGVRSDCQIIISCYNTDKQQLAVYCPEQPVRENVWLETSVLEQPAVVKVFFLDAQWLPVRSGFEHVVSDSTTGN